MKKGKFYPCVSACLSGLFSLPGLTRPLHSSPLSLVQNMRVGTANTLLWIVLCFDHFAHHMSRYFQFTYPKRKYEGKKDKKGSTLDDETLET